MASFASLPSVPDQAPAPEVRHQIDATDAQREQEETICAAITRDWATGYIMTWCELTHATTCALRRNGYDVRRRCAHTTPSQTCIIWDAVKAFAAIPDAFPERSQLRIRVAA
jgi:hypothetical protein